VPYSSARLEGTDKPGFVAARRDQGDIIVSLRASTPTGPLKNIGVHHGGKLPAAGDKTARTAASAISLTYLVSSG
jgi:hypothetical protein